MYGGRDKSETNQNISNENIKFVKNLIEKNGFTIKQSLTDGELSAQMIYDPQNCEIEQKKFANKGHGTRDIRRAKRKLVDIKHSNSNEQEDIKRTSLLEVIELKDIEDIDNFKKNYFSNITPDEQKACIEEYSKNGTESYVKRFFDSDANLHKVAEECVTAFKPYITLVHQVLENMGKTINIEDIYNDNKYVRKLCEEIIKTDNAVEMEVSEISVDGETAEKWEINTYDSFSSQKDQYELMINNIARRMQPHLSTTSNNSLEFKRSKSQTFSHTRSNTPLSNKKAPSSQKGRY